MSNVNQAILSRISKLLALANSQSATEAEAALAAEHVQRLLQEYQLTLSQVEAAGNEPVTPRTKLTTGSGQRRGAMYKWQRDLMEALAGNNFCLHQVKDVRVWGVGKRRDWRDGKLQRYALEKQHLLVGREVNVVATVQTYDYLNQAMTRLAGAAGYDVGRLTRELNWFRAGMVSRLVARLVAVRRTREEEDTAPIAPRNGTHRELVLADAYSSEFDLNNDHLNNYPAGTTAARRRAAAERYARLEAEAARLVSTGMDTDEAWYRAWGYGERAAAMAKDYRARQRRRGGRGHTRNWSNADRAEHEKYTSVDYQAGCEAGEQIGLDSQIAAASRAVLPRQ